MKRKLLSVLLTLCLAFSLLPTATLADEAGEEGTAEGGGQTTCVAQIDGGGTYATLQEAINAATGNATVTLLADVSEDVTIGKNITLDLGGKTLTNTNANKATLTVAAGATATVMNGSIVGGTSYYTIQNNGTATFEDVTATAGNNGSSMIDNYGDLTIKSGTYTGGLDTIKNESNAKLTITGGTFTLTKGTSKGFTGVVFNYGELNISGGEFIQSDKSAPYGQAQVIHTDKSNAATKTTITGGVFKNLCTRSTAWTIRTVGSDSSFTKVSGGTFNKSISDGYCADGFIPTKNADGTYGVKEGKYVVKVGSTGYETFDEAIDAANKSSNSSNSKTIKLLEDLTVDHQIVIKNVKGKAITLDLGGKTLTNSYDGSSYSLLTRTAVTMKNGTYKSTKGSARGIGAVADFTLENATLSAAGLVGLGCSATDATYTVKNSTVIGNYALANFANNATINIIESSTITGSGVGIYHNGSNSGLKLTATDSTITAAATGATNGIYVSGSTSTMTAAGAQQVSLTNCTVSGGTAVEVKYTDLTLTDCTVKSTSSAAPSYSQNNNGSAASGFAVVSTDNAMNNTTPKPEGTIIIKGNGSYTGLVGLGALESVKDNFTGFKDETIKVSGGTFSSEVKPEYCADGYVPKANSDGTYGVEEYLPVEVWTDYTGTKVASYKTIAEAAEGLGKNKWIVIGKDYTLNADFTIPEGVYLDVAENATLTVAENVTLTVAANAKRLGVRTGATLVNNGTIMVLGTSYASGSVMVQDNANIDLEKLTVPNGYFLGKNGNKYYAAKALFEVTFSDGSTKQLGELADLAGATKVTLLADVTDFAGTIGSTDKVADNFVLDLGGYTLTGKATATSPVLSISVPMTIQNGTIKYASTDVKHSALVTSADVTIAATAVIDGGRGYGIEVDGYAGHTLIVNGTVKSDGDYAITGNGREEVGGIIRDCNITVNAGATISAPNGVAIYHPEKGTVTINGGTINGATGGVQMCAGTLEVTGGTITATGNGDTSGKTGDGSIPDGAAVSIVNRNYPGGIPSATITGGTLTSANGVDAVNAYSWSNNAKTDWNDAGEYVNISGGTFSSIPDNMNALCAAGYIPFKNADGTYGVTRPSSGSSGSYDPTYSVSTPSKTENGSVTVSPKSASKGDTVTVTVKPDSGYVLETLTVTDKNGNELTLKDKGNGKYTFTMPAGKVEVKVTFMEDNSMLNFFYDVPNGAYFYEAVKWAVENGITTGVGNDLFAPEQPCTRAQIVTFLWRAAGSPEPKGAASGMTDVVSGSYYEKAVAWAIENGITTGTTTSTFSPDATCTRAQAVTFLARALSAKAASAAEFSDVPTDSYFADAVAWAAANGVTEGIGGGLFGSDNDCTRGQIVTFLYRAYNK